LSWTGQGAAAARFYDEAKQRGWNGMSQWREVRARATDRLSRLLGVANDEITFVGSTTEGLNLVVSAVPWRNRDEIVLLEDEFPSVVRACESTERFGVRLKRVPVPSEALRGDALVGALTASTRMVAASHVHWVTGTRLDLERLSAACRANGTMLVVDGVQALGAVPSALGETDVYCASTFKWVVSGFGLGIVVVRDRVRETLHPTMRGYNNPPGSHELHYSHVNYPGIYALDASLEYLERIGWEQVYARVDDLWRAVAGSLGAHGSDLVTPRTAHAGIVSCRVSDPEAVRDTLASKGIYVEAREGLLRISPHFYNNAEDIRAFSEALAAL
jgi:selenocysteine lyase/cysteine desulfurase